jgi:pimeloyl-ACP methyl ester carboxylesterase
MAVWQLALLHPERVRGVVGMSVPFLPRGPVPPVKAMRELFGENFFYILYFQEPGVADAALGADPARTLRRLMGGLTTEVTSDPEAAARMFAPGPEGFIERLPEPGGLPSWITPEELDHYVAEFTRTGFTGGINWYRNFDRNWELTEHLAGTRVAAPSLFVGGAHDPVLMMTPPGIGDADLADHRGNVIVEGAGHWVQQEKPDEVNAALLGFLDQVP